MYVRPQRRSARGSLDRTLQVAGAGPVGAPCAVNVLNHLGKSFTEGALCQLRSVQPRQRWRHVDAAIAAVGGVPAARNDRERPGRSAAAAWVGEDLEQAGAIEPRSGRSAEGGLERPVRPRRAGRERELDRSWHEVARPRRRRRVRGWVGRSRRSRGAVRRRRRRRWTRAEIEARSDAGGDPVTRAAALAGLPTTPGRLDRHALRSCHGSSAAVRSALLLGADDA